MVFIILLVLAFLSEGFYGGADNINHYFISRYSFRYPYLFLDTWGRPVFTIMSSPFSQFGFGGLKLFNVLLGCLSAFLAFLTARKIGIRQSWLAILFVIFTPMYFLMTLTGLTEIQFGFILILSVYFFFDEKYLASAIIISFLPFSRSEGIVLLPFLFIALLMKRKYYAVPFLATGFLLFSIVGYFFVHHDFFWIIMHSPYPLHHPIYTEKGPLLHFVTSSPDIFGIPLLILFLAGIGISGYLFFSAEKKHRLQIFLEIWMLELPVLLFFAVHSVLYWKALFGSMGIIRVITGVLPLAAIVSVKAFDHLEKTIFKKESFRNVFLFLVIIFLIISNFSINHYPVLISPRDQNLKNAANWVKQTPLIKQKILYTDLDVPFYLDLDPYNEKYTHVFSSEWLRGYPENTVLIWDSYFGTHESDVPLERINKTGVYRLINIFQPIPYLNTEGEQPCELCIFKKDPSGSKFDNKAIRDSITAKNSEISTVRFITGTTFEKNIRKNDIPFVSREVARSGLFSYKVPGNEEFKSSYEIDLSKIISRKDNITIRVSCFVYPLIPFKENDTRLVITLKDRGDFYHSLHLDSAATRVNQWNKISFMATFPVIKNSDRVVVYFWHRGKKEFYIDDLKIEVVYFGSGLHSVETKGSAGK
jgi:hypothetical protein